MSLLLVLPFMTLELINTRRFNEGFPIPLFGFMWLLAVSFILVLMPVVRSLSSGHRTRASRFALLCKVVLLILIAGLWIGLIRDQLPCFMGVPNCD